MNALNLGPIERKNVLNVRKLDSGEKWKGELESDGNHAKFGELFVGLRAGIYLLARYQVSYGITTVEAIGERWAPRTHNDTEEWIEVVCEEARVRRGYELVLFDAGNDMKVRHGQRATLWDVVRGMAKIEAFRGYQVPHMDLINATALYEAAGMERPS